MHLSFQGAHLRRPRLPQVPLRHHRAHREAGALEAPGSGVAQQQPSAGAALEVAPSRSGAFAVAASVGLHAAILLTITQTSLLAPSLTQVPAPAPQVFYMQLVPARNSATAVESPPAGTTLPAAPAMAASRQPERSATQVVETRKTVARSAAADSPFAAAPTIRVSAAVSEPAAVPDFATRPAAPVASAAGGAQTQTTSDSPQAGAGSSQLARAPSNSVAAPEPLRRAPPAYLHAPEPEYPSAAREDGQEGLVVLRVLVSTAGRPVQVQVARPSGFRALDRAAAEAVRKWRFSAATDGPAAIESWMDIPVRFRLE